MLHRHSLYRGKREEGKEPVSITTPDSAWVWRISRLTRDGIAKPVRRDEKFSGATGDRDHFFPQDSADHKLE